MANKKRELNFALTDDDYKAFGRYRIMYTDQGHKMVRRHRITYLLTAVMIAGLFTVFPVDPKFTYLMYVLSIILVVVGLFFSEKMVVKQQDRAIDATKNSAERVHAADNIVRFNDDDFTTAAGGDEQTFSYKDIKLIDLTEEAIYVWMSDSAIMPLPLHAFSNMAEMKSMCKWLREKNKEQGGTASNN